MPPTIYASSATHTLRPSRTPSSTTATTTQTLTSTPVLRLRATGPPQEASRRPRIQWAEDVVDNEGLGRKKSKGIFKSPFCPKHGSSLTASAPGTVCCIYHAPHPVGESSDESSSSSDSDPSSGDEDGGAARLAGGNGKGKGKGKQHSHNHDHAHEHGEGCDSKPQRKEKHKSRNAYEKMPKSKKGGSEIKG